jgi:hypothetical protein
MDPQVGDKINQLSDAVELPVKTILKQPDGRTWIIHADRQLHSGSDLAPIPLDGGAEAETAFEQIKPLQIFHIPLAREGGD